MVTGRNDPPSPSLVLALVQRLPDDSLTAALVAGGRQWFGYTRQLGAMHDLFDALNINTQVSGNWASGKPPKFPHAHRPDSQLSEAKADAPKKASVKDLYRRFAQRGVASA